MNDSMIQTATQHKPIAQPKWINQDVDQWKDYKMLPFKKKDKNHVTVIYGFVERRKSFFFGPALKRLGFNYIDLGDHYYEDVTVGKEFGSRGWCNPTYFTSGALIRKLESLRKEHNLSKEEIVKRYAFVGGGGQVGPCRYGMYPQEYFKVVNDAGYKNFRIYIFNSDTAEKNYEPDDAVKFNMTFRINLVIGLALADALHARDMEIRPYEANLGETKRVLAEVEADLFDAMGSRLYLFRLPQALKRARKKLDAIPKVEKRIPKIFITGEFFANHAHNEGNYRLRDFCIKEGCEVNPALFTERVTYDFFRRLSEAKQAIKYESPDPKTRKHWKKYIRKQRAGFTLTKYFSDKYLQLIGAKVKIHDVFELSRIAEKYYSYSIFGGESNMEVAEAILAAGTYEGFISSKPFGCMPSSGVSDGVQSKIQELYPELNFLAIETSGDNEANILNRVSMLIFKAKQQLKTKLLKEQKHNQTEREPATVGSS
jgi:predicted nucleotide-binding protein (sugar kinase/HSP70/actin superfamily)